jgi:F-type H+-transporting ATPase subunit delta
MAARSVAGRRYALAMLDIARADGDFDAWLDAAEVLDALTASSRYVEALQADGMTDEAFQQVVNRLLPNIGTKQLNLFRLVRRKKRLALGPSIASFFRELLDEERGVVRATVTSAIELGDERVAAIRDQLSTETGQSVELETAVDPELIGGLVIRVGDQLLDGSTRGRLRALRSHLERATL